MVEKTDDLVISISTDLATVKRSLKRLEQDISSTTGKVQKQFDGLGKGIDNSMTAALQARIDKMVGIGSKGAKEWNGALADQGKELERLRAKYSPLFATINNYKSAVADIRRAHAVGAISANEMTAAIQRERQAALASTAAIKGRNAALAQTHVRGAAGQGFQTANIAAQFQDIAVTSAMGMNPLQIALQQGTQLSSVLNTMGNGRQVVSGLAAAFTSLVSPVSLLTIGLVAGGAAAIQYFSTMEWGGAKSEATLKKEAELVNAVAEKWGDVLPALKAYNDERQRLAGDKERADALAIGSSAQWDDLRAKLGDVDVEIADIVSRLAQMGQDTEKVSSLQRAFRELTDGIADGTATTEMAQKVQEELAAVIKDNATPELQKYLDIFEKLAPAIDKASTNAKKFAIDQAIALTSRHPSQGAYGGVLRSPDGTIQGGGTVLPDNGPVPESRPLIELDGMPGAEAASKKTETAATRAANAYRDLIKSANDRIAQLKLETELTGQYGIQTDAARFRLELLQQAEDKGRSLSEAQRAEIEQKVALYEKYSQALSETKLQQDLLDDAIFAGMSKQEQAVKQRLRSYGLPEDLGGKNAAMIRDQFNREELSDLTHSFLSEFTTGVVSGGKSIGEAFADAIKNAAANAMQKSLNSLFTQIGNAFASAVFGSGGGTTGAASVGSSVISAVGIASAGGGTSAAMGGSGAALAWNFWKSKGLADHQVAGVLGNIKAESAFNPLAVGDGGNAFGLFQHNDRRNNLFKAIGGRGNLGNELGQHEFAFSELMGPENRAWQALRSAKNAREATAAFAGFERPSGFSWKNPEGAHNFAGRLDGAEEALAKFGGTTADATKGLGALGSTLQSIPQALMANGGGAGILSSLTKYGLGLFSGSGQFASAWMKGGIGLYDEGGYTGPGGKYTPAGIVHKGEYVFDAAATRRIGVPTLERLRGYANGGYVGAPRAPRLNGRSSAAANNNQPGVLLVSVSGASGDDHIRTLVKQGVGEGLSQYNKTQERGGFGTLQMRYGNQKG